MVFLYAYCIYFYFLFVTSDNSVGSKSGPHCGGEQGETEERQPLQIGGWQV